MPAVLKLYCDGCQDESDAQSLDPKGWEDEWFQEDETQRVFCSPACKASWELKQIALNDLQNQARAALGGPKYERFITLLPQAAQQSVSDPGSLFVMVCVRELFAQPQLTEEDEEDDKPIGDSETTNLENEGRCRCSCNCFAVVVDSLRCPPCETAAQEGRSPHAKDYVPEPF